MKIIKCKYCGKEFETDGSFKRAGQITAHMRTCILNPKRELNIAAQKRGSMTMHNKVALKQSILKNEIEQTRKPRIFICSNPMCKKEYQLNLTDKEYDMVLKGKKYITKFCCRSCANGKGMSHEMRSQNIHKKSIRIKYKKSNRVYYFKQCPICNKWFLNTHNNKCCSIKCKNNLRSTRQISESTRLKLSIAGRKSVAKQFLQKRSKCEDQFYQMCKKYFSLVEHNKPIFNGWDADILLPKLKIAIQWNGPWHYKQISKRKGSSLLAIQNRDKIKKNEILKMGWSLYIIKDQSQHKNLQKMIQFIENHFKRFIKFISNHINQQFYEEFELI